ncbi:MAG: hypothetical protein JWN15_2415 [Firmicutes bacterium]|nr:hypothetical protein [Bacillota bacterium]
MLLREYLLLDLGHMTAAEAGAWQGDMVRRREADACRDLLAFWRPRQAAGVQLFAYPVASLKRFTQTIPLEAFVTGLLDAAQEALLVALRLEAARAGNRLEAGGQAVCTVSAERHGEVAAGRLALDLAALQTLLGSDRELNVKVLTNAIAYHFEQAFGYAQAAQHPVAYEESMRPKL